MSVASISPFIPSLEYANLGYCDDVRRCDLESELNLAKFSSFFLGHFLTDMEWCLTFKRFYQVVACNTQEYFFVRVSIRHGQIVLTADGASFNLESAADTACHYLSLKIKELVPYFCMPRYLLAYPNRRGHCYVIAALMPFSHSFPFVNCLSEAYADIQMRFSRGELIYNSTTRFAEDVPFYWIDLMYKVSSTYRRVASFSDPVPGVRAVGNGDVAAVAVPEILHESLHNELIDSLARYCHSSCRRSGGDERVAYQYIISKLFFEIPEMVTALAIRYNSSYTCTSCSGVFADQFISPFMRIPPDTDIQDFIDKPLNSICYQRFKPLHCGSDGSMADHKVRFFSGTSYVSAPQLLVFAVEFNPGVEPKDAHPIPGVLNLCVDGVVYTYIHHASTICFSCFRNPALGVDYADFYHPQEADDEQTGEHTYTQLRVGDDYFELNNGGIFTPDSRVFRRLVPGTLVFYQLQDFSNYSPLVNRAEVYDNPEYCIIVSNK